MRPVTHTALRRGLTVLWMVFATASVQAADYVDPRPPWPRADIAACCKVKVKAGDVFPAALTINDDCGDFVRAAKDVRQKLFSMMTWAPEESMNFDPVKQIRELTGIDIRIDAVFMRVACDIAEVDSLEQLADVVNLPAVMVENIYPLYQEQFSDRLLARVDRHLEIARYLVPALMDIGYPHLPLPYGDVKEIATQLFSQYGSRVLYDLHFHPEVERLDLDFVTPELLASAFSEGSHLIGVADVLNVKPDLLFEYMLVIDEYVDPRVPPDIIISFNEAVFTLAKVAKQYGLNDLQ